VGDWAGIDLDCDDPLSVAQVLLDVTCVVFEARPVVPVMDAVRVNRKRLHFEMGSKLNEVVRTVRPNHALQPTADRLEITKVKLESRKLKAKARFRQRWLSLLSLGLWTRADRNRSLDRCVVVIGYSWHAIRLGGYAKRAFVGIGDQQYFAATL